MAFVPSPGDFGTNATAGGNNSGGDDGTELLIYDSWIPAGGRWIYFQFGTSIDITNNGYWLKAFEPILISDTAPLTGQIEHVQLHREENISVLTVALRLDRVVGKDEVIQAAIGGGPLAQTNLGARATQVGNFFPRNFSNCDTSGTPVFAPRVGSGTGVTRLDPTLTSQTDINPIQIDLDAELATTDDLDIGEWNSNNAKLLLIAGSLTKTASDSDFGNKASVNMSSVELAVFLSISDSNQTALINPETESFTQFAVIHTSGSPINEFSPQYISQEIIPVFERGSADTTGNATSEYWHSPYWTAAHDNKGIFETYIRERALSTDLVGQADTTTRGNPLGRTQVIGVRWDHINKELTWFSFGGNEIDQKVIADPLDVSNIVYVPDDGSGIGDVVPSGMGLQTVGSVKVARFLSYKKALDWFYVRAYAAFLDEEYQTSANTYYYDPNASGSSNVGTASNPFTGFNTETTQRAFLAGAGDQILFPAGASTSGIAVPYDIQMISSADRGSLGYSPAHPFLFGISGGVTSGYFTTEFTQDTDAFVKIKTRGDNIAIAGHKFVCPTRNVNDASYAGISGMNSTMFGLFYNQRGYNSGKVSGIQIVDSEIRDSARHGITLRHYGATDGYFKHNYVTRTTIHDIWNPEYAKSTRKPDIQISTGSPTTGYGVAGVYAEGINGLHIQDSTFYRVGWQPGVSTGTMSGFLYTSSGVNGPTFFTGGTSGVSAGFNGYTIWYSGNTSANFQRAVVSSTSLSVSEQEVTIAREKSPAPWQFTIDTDYTPDLASINLGGATAADVDVYFIDVAPRTTKNADIFVVDSGEFSTGTELAYQGYVTVSDTIFAESGGFNILSGSSFLYYGNVSVNNPYSMIISDEYTTVKRSHFGGSSGEPIRRAPVSVIAGASWEIQPGATGGSDGGGDDPPPPPTGDPNAGVPGTSAGAAADGWLELPDPLPTPIYTLSSDVNALSDISGVVGRNGGGTIYLQPGVTYNMPLSWRMGGRQNNPLVIMTDRRNDPNYTLPRATVKGNIAIGESDPSPKSWVWFEDFVWDNLDNTDGFRRTTLSAVNIGNRSVVLMNNWTMQGVYVKMNNGFSIQGYSRNAYDEAYPFYNFRLHRCVLEMNGGSARDQTIFVKNTDNIFCTGTYMLQNAWRSMANRNTNVAGPEGHHVYLQQDVGTCIFEENFVESAQATGMQFRSGGVSKNNIIYRCPVGFVFGNEGDVWYNNGQTSTLVNHAPSYSTNDLVWNAIDLNEVGGLGTGRGRGFLLNNDLIVLNDPWIINIDVLDYRSARVFDLSTNTKTFSAILPGSQANRLITTHVSNSDAASPDGIYVPDPIPAIHDITFDVAISSGLRTDYPTMDLFFGSNWLDQIRAQRRGSWNDGLNTVNIRQRIGTYMGIS